MVSPPAATSPVLCLTEAGVAYGDRVVLQDLTLEIASIGVTVLMGPGAAGKSTLLRSICDPGFGGEGVERWGEWSYQGRPLAYGAALPALVEQKAKLLLATVFENLVQNLPARATLTPAGQRAVISDQLRSHGLPALVERLDDSVLDLPAADQRKLAVLRCVSSDPALLCVDEPLVGLEESAAQEVIAFLRQESRRRAVLVVTHNQRYARELGGWVFLLAGGSLQESLPAEAFFTAPRTEVGRVYLRTGSCALPSPSARPEELAPDFRRESEPEDLPTGFRWLQPGRLAGTARPGLLRDLEQDLAALQALGVTVLVTLTEDALHLDAEQRDRCGLRVIWCPIDDMHAPSHQAAQRVCAELIQLMRDGAVVAFHCRAGLGRTGTMLAALLIHEQGLDGAQALEAVRSINPRWVQSEIQVRFLNSFGVVLNG